MAGLFTGSVQNIAANAVSATATEPGPSARGAALNFLHNAKPGVDYTNTLTNG